MPVAGRRSLGLGLPVGLFPAAVGIRGDLFHPGSCTGLHRLQQVGGFGQSSLVQLLYTSLSVLFAAPYICLCAYKHCQEEWEGRKEGSMVERRGHSCMHKGKGRNFCYQPPAFPTYPTRQLINIANSSFRAILTHLTFNLIWSPKN